MRLLNIVFPAPGGPIKINIGMYNTGSKYFNIFAVKDINEGQLCNHTCKGKHHYSEL
jgi:hypothetical protein